MTKTFKNYDDMVTEIMWAISDLVAGSDIGVSSRPISRYVIGTDEEGCECKARISDHDATASCSGKIVAELLIGELGIEEVTDECGEFDHLEVSRWYVAEEFIETAVAALKAAQFVEDDE